MVSKHHLEKGDVTEATGVGNERGGEGWRNGNI